MSTWLGWGGSFTSIRTGELDFNLSLEYIPGDSSMTYANQIEVEAYKIILLNQHGLR